MTPQDLLDHFGTQAEIARFFGIHPVSVNQWFHSGKVPAGRQYEAQIRTGGVLMIKPTTAKVGADKTAGVS